MIHDSNEETSANDIGLVLLFRISSVMTLTFCDLHGTSAQKRHSV